MEQIRRNELPESCFSVLPSTGELILIKRGEKGGYWQCGGTHDREWSQKLADRHNRIEGFNPAQVKAMEFGSLFGFDMPGANPQTYLDAAKLDRTYDIAGTIKDTVISTCYPSTGKLHKFNIAGYDAYYLELAAIPDKLMGVKSDIIIRADLVGGKPLVAVRPRWEQNGTCNMELENGSFTRSKAIVEDYHVVATVDVGTVEYALGEMDARRNFFVTWERTPQNDRSGPNYYWGHYHDNRVESITDFCDRAYEKYKMLAEQRQKPSIRAQLAAAEPEQREKPAARAHDRETR